MVVSALESHQERKVATYEPGEVNYAVVSKPTINNIYHYLLTL